MLTIDQLSHQDWTHETLTALYTEWTAENALPAMSADELLAASWDLGDGETPPVTLTPAQTEWLHAYVRTWDACTCSAVATPRQAVAP